MDTHPAAVRPASAAQPARPLYSAVRGAFAPGRPLWYVASFLIVWVAPAALFWVLLVVAGGAR